MREHTTFDVEGGVATLTLARPELRNAITSEAMLLEIITAFEDAERDPGVRVLIVTGMGTAFSAGGNVHDMASRSGMFSGSTGSIAEAYRRGIQKLTTTVLDSDLALIAAVNGPAIGAGFDLALGCDLRIASTTARFAHTFVDLGILPGDGGAWLLARAVGWQRAAELSFTGRSLSAGEALQDGLLLDVVEPADLMPAAHRLASTIAGKPAHSIRLTKRLLRHARSTELPAFLDLTAAYQAIAHDHPEHRTAVESYVARLRDTD